LIHHESASRGHQRTREEQAEFERAVDYMQTTWSAQLMHDPFYNPNLSLNPPGFEIAFPPRDRGADVKERRFSIADQIRRPFQTAAP
jgi:hypothetical protein